MYDAVSDPYCYRDTTVLKNIPGIQSQAVLDEFEAAITAQRSDEPLPAGGLSVWHYCAIHHHLFQDVYPWAGKFRAVRIAKDGSALGIRQEARIKRGKTQAPYTSAPEVFRKQTVILIGAGRAGCQLNPK